MTDTTMRQVLTEDEIIALGHRTASTYAHRSDPSVHVYSFFRRTLVDFARAIESSAIERAAKVCDQIARDSEPWVRNSLYEKPCDDCAAAIRRSDA